MYFSLILDLQVSISLRMDEPFMLTKYVNESFYGRYDFPRYSNIYLYI